MASQGASEEGWGQDSPELTYIHDTLLKTMRELGR